MKKLCFIICGIVLFLNYAIAAENTTNLLTINQLVKAIKENNYIKTKEILDKNSSLISFKLDNNEYVIPVQYLDKNNKIGFKFDDKMFDLLLKYKPNFNHNVIGNEKDFYSVIDFISLNSELNSTKSIEIFDKIIKNGFSIQYYNQNINTHNVLATAVKKPMFFDKLLQSNISPKAFLINYLDFLIDVGISEYAKIEFDKTFQRKFSNADKEKLLDTREYLFYKLEFLHLTDKILKKYSLVDFGEMDLKYLINFATYTQDDDILDYFLIKEICENKTHCNFLKEKLKIYYPKYKNLKIK